MDKKTLEAMSLAALRIVGQERGVVGAAALTRTALIEELTKPVPPTSPSGIEPSRESPGPAAEAPPAHPLPSSPRVTTGVPELTGEPLGLLDYEEPPDAYGVDDCEVLFK